MFLLLLGVIMRAKSGPNRHRTFASGSWMHGLSLSALAAGVAVGGMLLTPANAQDKQDKKAAAPAAGPAIGSAFTGKATPSGGTELVLDPKQTEAVKKIGTYFSELNNMKGVFVQTDADKTRSRGRFYLKRPGKFRFDYGAPSKKIMASDGAYLRIQEPDVTNPDVYQLDNTPFRLLLKKDVDLIRDARILDVQESEDLVVLALQDKSPDAPGRVQLYFVKKPGFELKEWVINDAQGLETRVEISELNKTEDIDAKLFVWDSNILKQK